jgi:single-stranded DNA-binding protein
MSSARGKVSGKVAFNPEVKTSKQGNEYIEFKVPHDTREADPNRDGNLTNWYKVVVFGYRAKGLITLANQGKFVKGTFVAVEGKQTVSMYAKKDGGWAVQIDIEADDVDGDFFSGGGSAPDAQAASSTNRWAKPEPEQAEITNIDDVPF